SVKSNAMKKSFLTLALTALFALLAGSLAVAPARADVSISVAPSLIELSADPGNTGETTVTVFNDGDEAFSGTPLPPNLPNEGPARSAKSWLKVAPESAELAAGKQMVFRIQMQVPNTAKAGGNYAQVLFKTGPKGGAAGSNVSVAGELGVPLLFTVKGNEPL